MAWRVIESEYRAVAKRPTFAHAILRPGVTVVAAGMAARFCWHCTRFRVHSSLMRPAVRCLIMFAMLCLSCAAGLAAGPAMPAIPALCGPAITAAEDSFRLPPRLLEAIAQVESGRPDATTGRLQPWPWTINAEGQGAFFATEAHAIAAVRDLQARGVRSIDVGCLQVNLMFHPTAFNSLEQAFDPRANAMYAARFLNALYAVSNKWLSAIGDYHSQTAPLGDAYRRRVLALWHDPTADWHLGLAVAYRDFAARSRTYDDFAPASSVYADFAGSFATAAVTPRH
ncbi:MAG TPA: transglycosylase SLT domain-containing protein [Acetobacteraceae bacterium]|nr:transglycosylase SLT domain-containing protein [Acetobacteraceae bacterium]